MAGDDHLREAVRLSLSLPPPRETFPGDRGSSYRGNCRRKEATDGRMATDLGLNTEAKRKKWLREIY